MKVSKLSKNGQSRHKNQITKWFFTLKIPISKLSVMRKILRNFYFATRKSTIWYRTIRNPSLTFPISKLKVVGIFLVFPISKLVVVRIFLVFPKSPLIFPISKLRVVGIFLGNFIFTTRKSSFWYRTFIFFALRMHPSALENWLTKFDFYLNSSKKLTQGKITTIFQKLFAYF